MTAADLHMFFQIMHFHVQVMHFSVLDFWRYAEFVLKVPRTWG